VTQHNVDELRARHVARLVTTTPNLGGRSFGTNVMEAAMLAILGKRWDEVSDADYRALLARLDFRPYVSDLVAHATT
jgi:hypothetical protein